MTHESGMSQPAFRFAPSPNGALHLGHAYSALLNAGLAAKAGGRFLIRMEDIDLARCPRHLAEAALADLRWLGLTWEDPVRFQSERMEDYRYAQDRLLAMDLLYPCFCSRRQVAGAGIGTKDPEGQPLYPGTCRALSNSERQDRIAAGERFALRLDMAKAVAIIGGPPIFEEKGKTVSIDPAAWGDIILARKDIGTSYHIAVVVDDALQGVTHVVRGRDLYPATPIHRLLQNLLGLPEPHYHHHRLIGDNTGRKLAKSAGDRSLATLRAAGVSPDQVRQALASEEEFVP
jgi:glutamyl-Q tRNA(Asp) synthetase